MGCVYRVEIFSHTPFSLLSKEKAQCKLYNPSNVEDPPILPQDIEDLLSDNEIIKSKRPNGVLLFTAEYFPKAAYS